MSGRIWMSGVLIAVLSLLRASQAGAETCTTQSAMQPTQRDAIAGAAASVALKIQNSDSDGVRAITISQFQTDFSGLASLITSTAPRLKAGRLEVEQVYLLDASTLTRAAGGGSPDAQFFCSLNKTQQEVQFTIPQLPPAQYAFAMVKVANASPWRLSMLLQQERGQWLLAGLYPKPLMAAGHDGLWYWQQARTYQSQKEAWNAWLYFQQARTLLQPAGFVSTPHLDKLDTELTAAAPPAVNGLSADQPLVIKAADGVEYRFTSITSDDSLSSDKVDIAAHIKADALGDAATARKRNDGAAAALVAAHPELRRVFHGVEILTDVPGQGQTPYATEQAMSVIR